MTCQEVEKKPVFHFEIPRKYAIKINILVYAVRKKNPNTKLEQN